MTGTLSTTNALNNIVEKRQGKASWYGNETSDLQNRTSAGLKFDPNWATFAHNELPAYSIAKVSLKSDPSKSVIAVATDTGGFNQAGHAKNKMADNGLRREIDVAKGVADKLGFTPKGLADVDIAVLHKPDKKLYLNGDKKTAAEKAVKDLADAQGIGKDTKAGSASQPDEAKMTAALDTIKKVSA